VTYPITLIVFGKSKLPAHRELMEHYQTLLKRYVRLTLHELPESKQEGTSGLADEAARLRKHLKPQDSLILLSEAGPVMTSQDFAETLSTHLNRGTSLVFAVGSSHGWNERLKQEAARLLSLSPMDDLSTRPRSYYFLRTALSCLLDSSRLFLSQIIYL
jgi:23S rRNA (pseudouridine1915-N3)-methyltransferase